MSDERAVFVVDLAGLIDRLGGDAAFADECIRVFEEELPALLAAMREGSRTRIADRIGLAAHTLRGSVANFCRGGPAATLTRIEQLARDGRVDEAGSLLPILESELVLLTDGLHVASRQRVP